ncbi:Methyltransferase domain-containing protein [Nitrosomonas cryotolerans]|uniref:Methyltransferase domain-containing protein n=2 Tax=Nitrosomonas cryotolerans TaxID=44575 RepID=A0A1N6GXF4_9PROT|nr:Methyltransferase domain-containing protein [Nitrosomonas cryotolerans]SIO12261.1 Methyltransferase domain-containing protein [Nitrosomonas cryotolerans ATCC 49181]
MNKDWSQGYFTDVGYTFGYYRELSPTFIRFCLLLQGIAAPDPADAHYCELGIGQGLSLNLHAATHTGRFWGTDFNPAQAAFAQGLTRATGLTTDIRDESFDELLQTDLPPMDFITLHGIWTWVSPENHQQIVALARKRLKPGGVLYISYNTLPGWSAAAPLRQLFALHDRYAGRTQTALTRVDAAVQFADRLLGCNPAYSRAIPGIADRLRQIKEQNRHYVAHEYFNREWNVMYFVDVAEQLAAAKLEFAASAALLDTVDAIHLNPAAQTMLKEIEHPVLREQLRDYFTFSQFRRDLFMRGTCRLSAQEKHQRLLDTRFVLLQAPADVPRKVTGSLLEGDLQAAIYEPLLSVLAERDFAPKSLRVLCASGEKAAVSSAQVLEAMIILVGMGHVSPCQDEAAVKQVRGNSERMNAEILRRAVYSRDIAYLAAPVIGGAVPVSRVQQLFLLAKVRQQPNPVLFAWQVFKDNNERLVKAGQVIDNEADSLQELERLYVTFNQQTRLLLKAVGAVR